MLPPQTEGSVSPRAGPSPRDDGLQRGLCGDLGREPTAYPDLHDSTSDPHDLGIYTIAVDTARGTAIASKAALAGRIQLDPDIHRKSSGRPLVLHRRSRLFVEGIGQ